MKIFPRLKIHLGHIRNNSQILNRLCEKVGISIAGVVKFCGSEPAISRAYLDGGCSQLATSRVEQLKTLRDCFPETQLMMLRLPMHSEVEEVVKYSDLSVNSEETTLFQLNKIAGKLGKKHGVLLMLDVGDLREGLYHEEELLKLADCVEKQMPHLSLKGIGTTFACYGGVLPNRSNLNKLSRTAKKIQEYLGRKLEIVSGGSSITLSSLLKQEIPPTINHLRIGGIIANPRGMRIRRVVSIPGMKEDTFTLSAEIIEIQEKPSCTEIDGGKNWRGERVHQKDFGIRKRAILALGAQDVFDPTQLTPCQQGIKIIGASSDHTIVDVTDYDSELQIGDVLEFSLMYENLLFSFQCSSVQKDYIEK